MAHRKKQLTPAAFLSYVRFDDKHEDGKISEIRERLSSEVRAQTGEEFPIFQDRNDIHWGENWESRLENALDTSTFLVPIITPSFFKSPSCRKELERFLEREDQLKRNDLILPIYYIEVDLKKAKRDPLLKIIFKHQYADWREMRFEPVTSPQYSRAFAQLATELRDAISRSSTRKETKTRSQNQAKPKRKKTSGRQAIVPESSRQAIIQITEPMLPSEKSEPRVRLVDISGHGEFTNIFDAVSNATPGDRIVIRPGIYQEKLLLIEKPLEIIGDGSAGEVIVRGTDDTLIEFKTELGRLSNLRIEHQGPGRRRGKGHQALYVRQGKLEVENCQIVTEGAYCIVVSWGAEPRLRKLQLVSLGAAILFSGGHGTLEDCDIRGSLTTLCMASTANPTIRRNRIHAEGSNLMIQIFNDSAGTFEANEISGGSTAVDIRSGAHPTFRSNVIHSATDCGVSLCQGGEGLFENNQIENNVKIGVRIAEDSTVTLRENKITGNQVGVKISDSSGIFERNDLRGNSISAWDIASDSLAKTVRTENLE